MHGCQNNSACLHFLIEVACLNGAHNYPQMHPNRCQPMRRNLAATVLRTASCQ